MQITLYTSLVANSFGGYLCNARISDDNAQQPRVLALIVNMELLIRELISHLQQVNLPEHIPTKKFNKHGSKAQFTEYGANPNGHSVFVILNEPSKQPKLVTCHLKDAHS